VSKSVPASRTVLAGDDGGGTTDSPELSTPLANHLHIVPIRSSPPAYQTLETFTSQISFLPSGPQCRSTEGVNKCEVCLDTLLQIGCTVEVHKPDSTRYMEATLTRITDHSLYTVGMW